MKYQKRGEEARVAQKHDSKDTYVTPDIFGPKGATGFGTTLAMMVHEAQEITPAEHDAAMGRKDAYEERIAAATPDTVFTLPDAPAPAKRKRWKGGDKNVERFVKEGGRGVFAFGKAQAVAGVVAVESRVVEGADFDIEF